MQYYAAPMEGLTDRVWRQAQQKWFGPEGTAHRYYAPFLSPPENRVLIKKKMAELAPAANPGAPVIPQLLAKDGELAAWMIGELRALGYTEVNLNLGCPSGTVTAKGKGSGMLRDPAVLDAFLDAVFSHAEGPVSVKTRLGVSSPDEFAAILDIYNRYPICELTIHPRVMRQLYRGQADRAAFAEALPRCTMPVCYNGDVTTPEELRALETQFPQLSGIMIGRGFIADPALLRRARGGTGASREELRGYLDDLYHGYTELFGSAGCAVSRMKAHWFYLIHRFAGSEKRGGGTGVPGCWRRKLPRLPTSTNKQKNSAALVRAAELKKPETSNVEIIAQHGLQQIIAIHLADQRAGVLIGRDVGRVFRQDIAHQLVDRIVAFFL